MKSLKIVFALIAACGILSFSIAPDNSAKDFIPNENSNEAFQLHNPEVDNLKVVESRYFEEIDATITMTWDSETLLIASITDSSNQFSEEFLFDLKSEINTNIAAAAVSAGCGCSWYDVWCQGMCALCQGLGDCPFDQQ